MYELVMFTSQICVVNFSVNLPSKGDIKSASIFDFVPYMAYVFTKTTKDRRYSNPLLCKITNFVFTVNI